MLKMLPFCYPGLNKVTLVNQLSLLLICKTAIGETWNAATGSYMFTLVDVNTYLQSFMVAVYISNGSCKL